MGTEHPPLRVKIFSRYLFSINASAYRLSLSVEREVADSNHYLTGVIAFTSAAPVATTYNLPFLTQVMQVTSLNFYSTKHVGEHCKNIYWGLSGNFVPAYSGKKTINSREEI